MTIEEQRDQLAWIVRQLPPSVEASVDELGRPVMMYTRGGRVWWVYVREVLNVVPAG